MTLATNGELGLMKVDDLDGRGDLISAYRLQDAVRLNDTSLRPVDLC